MMTGGGTIMPRVGCSAPSDAMLPWLDAEGATLTARPPPACPPLYFSPDTWWLHSLTARGVLVGRRCVVVMFGTKTMDTKTLEHHGLEHFDKGLRGSLHLEVNCQEHIPASCRVSGPVGV